MEEPLAAQLEWWGNSSICFRFDALVTIEEAYADLTARGVLTAGTLADCETVEAWDLLCGASPYFRLVFLDGSTFEVEVHRMDSQGSFRLTEHGIQRSQHITVSPTTGPAARD